MVLSGSATQTHVFRAPAYVTPYAIVCGRVREGQRPTSLLSSLICSSTVLNRTDSKTYPSVSRSLEATGQTAAYSIIEHYMFCRRNPTLW